MMNRKGVCRTGAFKCAFRNAATGVSLSLCTLLLFLPAVFCGRLRAENTPGSAISVVSLNVATNDSPAGLAEEIGLKGLGEADIYLLQEVLGEDLGISSFAESLFPNRAMHVFYQGAFELKPGRMCGLAIISRFPLHDTKVIHLKKYNLNFRSRVRIAITARIDGPDGTITLINTHLDTRISASQRLEQLQPLVNHAVSTQLPTILGGDLNTNPHRWIFHLVPIPYTQSQGKAIRRYMEGLGFESAIGGRQGTHDFLGMQLDWIFLRGLRVGEVRVEPLKRSDHHAIFATVRVNPEAPK
ncbi:MAG: endonuclease/exonuclease/phosphatase family protein [Bryobacterales bacterium]|nr:endonuclease/exonuclease/phosphatase family protein [Bryobacterales bacterium]